MLYGRDSHPGTHPAASKGSAEDSEVHRLRAASRERHLIRPGADDRGHDLARVVEQHPGAAGGAVEAGGVGPAVVGRGEQDVPRCRVQRLGRCGVKVSAWGNWHATNANRPPRPVRSQTSR